MDTLLEAMLEAPDLVQKIDAAKSVLEAERKRRRQFYEEMTESQKTEFINGQVIVHSPAKWRHTGASGHLFRLLSVFVDTNHLGAVSTEKTLISLTRNDYEPDVCFFRREVSETFAPDQMQFPAPDFIAEILSPSTERNDRHIKKRDYAAHGVSEYWIIDSDLLTIEQYTLRDGDYFLLGIWKDDNLVISTAVTGFQIPARAVFDRASNLDALATMLPKDDQPAGLEAR